MSNWGDFWSVGDQMKLTSYLREVNFLLIKILILSKYEVNILLTLS